MLIATSPHVRKGKTRKDHTSGTHARRIENRKACRFRSDALNCDECATKSHQGDKRRARR